MSNSIRRSQILDQIHTLVAQEGHTEHLDALLAEHDNIALAEHDVHISHALAQVSQWERMQEEAALGNAFAHAVVEPAPDSYITLDEGDFVEVEVVLSHEEIDALNLSDFDDEPTLVYTVSEPPSSVSARLLSNTRSEPPPRREWAEEHTYPSTFRAAPPIEG